MPSLRRILKYAPVMVSVVLVILWVGGVFRMLAINVYTPSRLGVLQLGTFQGSLQYAYTTYLQPMRGDEAIQVFNYGKEWPMNSETILGRIRVKRIPAPHPMNTLQIDIPYLLLLTAVFPLNVAVFSGFRFTLRSWLAYLTFVSVELAYYLPNCNWKWFW